MKRSRRPITEAALVALALLAVAPTAVALAPPQVLVKSGDGRYSALMVAEIAAPAEAVFSLLTDYDQWERLSPSVETAELLDYRRGEYWVRSVTEACAFIFCKTIWQVQRIREEGLTLLGRTVPEQSNLKEGLIRWRVEPIAQRPQSRVTMELIFVPDFPVPPIVGPWLVERAMRIEAAAIAARLARLAEQQADSGGTPR